MPKQSGKKDREEKARRRLAKAQIELHAAQEKRSQAIARGEHEVEQARQRVARWVAKATERVERRAGAMARAEARLISISAPRRPVSPPRTASRTEDQQGPARIEAPEPAVTDPLATVEILEQREAESAARSEHGLLVVPENVEVRQQSAAEDDEFAGENNQHPW